MPGLLLAPRQGYALYDGVNFLRVFSEGFQSTTHLIITVLFLVASYGPLVSALGIVQRASGDAGVRDLLRRMLHWRVPARWYLLVAALPLASLVPAVAVARLTGVAPQEPVLPLAAGLIPLYLLFRLVTSGLEEPAWRGFLQPYMQRQNRAEVASYVVGGLWMLWRLPYLLVLYQGPALPATLIAFLVSLTGSSVILAWIYNNTGSVFLATLYHALGSVALTMATAWMGTHPGPLLVAGLVTWVVALLLLRGYGSDLVRQR